MKENWINDMKRQLEGHKMEPPKGLWESISSQMGQPSGMKSPSRRTGMAQWYWAAAVVLALIGFFAYYYHDNHEPLLQAETVSQPSEQTVSSESIAELSSLPSSEPLRLIKQNSHQGSDPRMRQTSPQGMTPVEEETNLTLDESVSESTSPDSTEVQHVLDKPRQTSDEPRPMRQVVLSTETKTVRHTGPSNRWSVGLSASGGLLATNNSVRVDDIILLQRQGSWNYEGSWALEGGDYSDINEYDAQSDTYKYDIGNYASYTRTEFVSKHHLPVRFGLSVQYQLNNRLALLSGINYTYLYSEFSIPLYQNIHDSQKLHYLGIPVGLAWQLWSTNHFRIYLSGGAMVEKCIRADLETGSTGKKPWQWSVNAAAGAEYTFIRQLGVYLEPSLGYYFDDGTSLEHYYKEHPLTPSIEFGLRLHLNDK